MSRTDRVSDADGPAREVGVRDHLGQRRLSAVETTIWYGTAFVTYVLTGLWQKWILTWFLGPMWLVTIVWLRPNVWDAIRPRDDEDGRR